MSVTGWWGNKVIISLHSNDGRRHKCWCMHYNDKTKECMHKRMSGKCVGSAHCELYVQKERVGAQQELNAPSGVPSVHIPSQFVEIEPKAVKEVKKESQHHYMLPGHYPNFGERLVGKVVLIDKLTSVDFGVIISENHKRITIECDDGRIVNYDKIIAIRRNTFWLIDDIKDED